MHSFMQTRPYLSSALAALAVSAMFGVGIWIGICIGKTEPRNSDEEAIAAAKSKKETADEELKKLEAKYAEKQAKEAKESAKSVVKKTTEAVKGAVGGEKASPTDTGAGPLSGERKPITRERNDLFE
jgi:cytoskeletal protein RodZ